MFALENRSLPQQREEGEFCIKKGEKYWKRGVTMPREKGSPALHVAILSLNLEEKKERRQRWKAIQVYLAHLVGSREFPFYTLVLLWETDFPSHRKRSEVQGSERAFKLH